ncbi:neuroblast differentiation-associated protein AHNAK-like isoform X2 [Etheostoma cragini]|uniref:neuroblast differentiation-associated protein AHNAK-like isoform X2 n=1 Tax=Etheostoma cragini TaxID=417921 RepID=UPI00155EB4CC|nr:neuroblast differentiation-associated protein AHNAK-like isoform X2 [Etheostoma cragini]
MCDCFHLAFPNWHAASSGTAGRRLRAPEPGPEDDSTCDEPSQFTESERPRPQGSSPVEEYPETEKYTDSDKECEAEHDPHHKSGSGKKTKKSGLGSMFEKRSTPKMSKLKEVHSPESGLIVKTAKDGCAEGLVYGGGGKEGIFIKEVVPESPASKSLKLKEGDQILSATVYFDNVSYEDAIQILEHAQAYRVKLCLKRKPDITETETAIETDAIPEEDVYAPEMREQGKTKRRGDARISWPKFPSFGKGKKSRFIRSHSSSEADEQRKLELSPTTSDTESPIKSQDALKGKKKQKTKFSVLTKRGRISSSEDQDTDAPTSAQMVSPECFESPSGGTPQIFATEDLKVVEDFRREQNDQKLTEPQTVQHKVELITIDSTLKTEDLTVALAGQGSPSGIKSPDGKKNKKERSELKMKISGKDKLHKKDTKAKSSPKRLKTLGASIEIADQPGNEKSDEIPSFKSQTKLQGDQLALNANTQIISSESSRLEMSVPKVELEISDVALIGKSPQKGEEKTKKGKDVKQKLETKTGPIFKLPKIGFSDIATEEIIPQMNVNFEERTPKMEKFTTEGTEVKKYPHERLSKSSLPKREDIVIPGMEDMSKKTKVKGIKEPKAVFTGHYEDIQAETVDLSFDVDSVKEAVSKLPGFKLPKVDMSGVPIPEEITVIDANAQRISVKTPTKTKHDAHFSKFDITASPEISKTTVKLPKITSDDLTTEELLIESKVDLKKTEKEYKTQPKQSDKEHVIIPGKESVQVAAIFQTQETQGKDDIKSENESAVTLKSKRAKITMTSFGISKPDIRIPDIGIDFPKQKQQKGDNVKGERTIFLQEEEISKTETRNKIGEVISDVKIPESESIEYIDSVDGSPDKKDGGIGLTGFGVNLNAASPKTDISFPQIRGEVKGVEYKVHTFKLPEYGAVTENISIDMPDAEKDVKIDGADIRTIEREIKGGKFKMPNLSISMAKVKGPEIEKDVDLPLPEAKAEVELPDIPEVEVNLGNVDVSIPEKNMEVKKPELDVQPWQVEGELDGQGSKFKKPKFGIKIPKLKEPEFDLSLSKKDVHVTLPEVKSEVQVPEAPKMDDSLGKAEVLIPVAKVEVKKPELKIKPLHTDIELQGQGGEFQMPKLGITMPKLKGPEFDSSLSKKVVDVTLPEAKAEVQLPAAPEIDTTLGRINVSIPKQKMEVEKPELDIKPLRTEGELDGQGGKFKMPKLGVKMPKIKVPELDLGLSKKDVDVTIPEASAEVKLPETLKIDASLGKAEFLIQEENIEVKEPEVKIKPLQTDVELEREGDTFKMPKLGKSMPKVKGPEIHFSLSKTDGDVTLPEAKAEVKVPEVELKEPSANVEIKGPEITEKDREGSPLKFKMPTFKLPKYGIGTPDMSVEISDMDKDVKINRADIKITEDTLAVDIAAPSIGIEGPSIDIKTTGTEHEGKGSKFKLPSLGFSGPPTKRPDVDLSLLKKDVDGTLPEAKADVKLPNIHTEAPRTDIEGLSIDLKTTGIEEDGKRSFKMPHLSFSMPRVKGPKMDLSLSDVDVKLIETKPDVKHPEVDLGKVDVSIPEAKMQVKKPEVEMQSRQTQGQLEGKGEKLKMPKFGIKMPTLRETEFDLSLSKRDVDIPLPQAKVKVKLPEAPKTDASLRKAEVFIPEAKMEDKKPKAELKPLQTEINIEGRGGKFQMPKFGITMPKVKGPEIDLSLSEKDVDVTIPNAKAEVKLPKAPEIALDMKPPACEAEIVGQGGKFKMPKFGISMPKVKGPEMDVSLSKKDVDVTLPKAKADVVLPEASEIAVDMKPQECEAEIDGQGGKYKTPKLGISMHKVKGPDFDFSLSKKDADITLPEAKTEVNLPDVELKEPSAKVEIKAPEIETQLSSVKGSPSKFKLPTFKFPKFGAATSNVSTELPDIDKEIKIDGADMQISVPDIDVDVPKVKAEIHLPEVEVKKPSGSGVIEQQPGVEVDAKLKKTRFSLPRFSFSKPTVKAPELDASLQDAKAITEGKVEVNVLIPETKAKVEEAELEVKPLQTEVKGQGSEFGMSMPKVKGPEFHLGLSKKDIDVRIPEAKADINFPDVDLKQPSAKIEMKAPVIEVLAKDTEGSPSKFKMPNFSFSMPKVKGQDVDVSLSKNDTDIPLAETKAEIKLPEAPKIDASLGKAEVLIPEERVDVKKPEVEIKPLRTDVELKGHGGEFQMPKFGIKMPKVKGPVIDLSFLKKDVDVTLPEAKADVVLPEPPKIAVDAKPLECEAEIDGQGGKFKMPKFGISMPKGKEPEIDVSFSRKDVDFTPPDTTAEVNISDVELKEPSAKVEIKAPEIKAQLSSVKGSPSKFQLPTFKFPKFGAATSNVSTELPDIDKEIKIDGADMQISVPDTDVDVPKVKAEIHLPEVEVQKPSGSGVIEQQPDIEVDAKPKKPRFSLPRFSFSKPSVKAPEVDASLQDAKVASKEGKVEVKGGEVDMKLLEYEAEVDGQGSRFKMPTFGISMPKGPEIDLTSSKKDVNVTLPEAKAKVQLSDVKIKQPAGQNKAPEMEAYTSNVEGSPSKLKMPTFTFPKFGAATPKVSVEVPDVDKDIKTDGATVDVTAPSIDTEGLSVDVKAKGSEIEGPGSKFKMPKFGISMSKVKGPDIDLSLSKKDVDVTIPEATTEIKLPSVEVKESEGAILIPDVPTVDVENKFKRPNWSFPKFSFSRTGGKTPDPDVNLETPKVDVTSPEAKSEVQGLSGAISMEVPPAAELDETLKKNKFTLPRFSFSKSSVKEPEVSAELPDVDFSLPEREVIVKQPEIKMKAPEPEVEHDGQESKFKLPKFGIALPKAKGKDLKASQKDVGITLPEVKAEVKLPEIESSASVEMKASDTEAKSKGVGGSPLKFKMPTLKMPTFGVATYDVTVGAPDADKVAETDGAKLKEDVTFNIKGPSVDIKTDVSKDGSETPKTEAESVGLGSPSKFKLPTFKMPKLSFSRPNPEDEHVPVDTECKENQVEMDVKPKGESKSAKVTLTSFGEILKNIDVEFDVPKTEEHLETSKEVHETDETSGKQLEAKEKETNQDTTKSPERTGWFKFPKFGLSSPSEPTKISEKDMHKDEKTPVGETVEEISPTFSVQSSDAFADISSAMTSEHAGLSLSSPTKVTVKYSEPMAATGLEEMHSNITSTTRTELISIEPNLPEKITILSSGVSSSSEDTLRLESGKIHVITSNIQATPEAQRAELLTAVQIQSAEGLLLESEANEAASWTVEDSQSSKKTVFERHLVMETSTERSESKETIVITKQITSMFDSSEPTLGATASSIQRLRESVHSEKMRFFDEADK